MGFRIESSDFDDFITTTVPSGGATPGGELRSVKLATPKGDITYQEQAIGSHLSIFQCHYAMDEDVTVCGKGESSLLEIQFNLSDKPIFYKNKARQELITPGRSGNISFLSAEENQAEILFKKGISYNTFDIHIPISLLDQYEGESKTLDSFLKLIHKDISSQLIEENINVDLNIYNLINQIRTCSYEGLTRRIYLESKVYELIAMLYAGADRQQKHDHLSNADRERILWAASLIEKHPNHSFTILELSRTVGINQTKLKTGFKTVFGNTIFGYLQEIRMAQAKKYLLDTQLSIHEIGVLLGYKNISNFSIAFKKIHGFSPIKLRDNGKIEVTYS